MTELTFAVTGMSCAHCENAIRAEVEQVAGVESVIADAASGTVFVNGADSMSESEIVAAVDEAGYSATRA